MANWSADAQSIKAGDEYIVAHRQCSGLSAIKENVTQYHLDIFIWLSAATAAYTAKKYQVDQNYMYIPIPWQQKNKNITHDISLKCITGTQGVISQK